MKISYIRLHVNEWHSELTGRLQKQGLWNYKDLLTILAILLYNGLETNDPGRLTSIVGVWNSNALGGSPL